MFRSLIAVLVVMLLPAHAAEPKVVVFDVSGMTCMLCAAKVKKILERVPGVLSANADYAEKRAEARYDPDKASPESLARAVTEAGFKATVRKQASHGG